jgi:pimeloyl-ACP methyl ester carboxylesterase
MLLCGSLDGPTIEDRPSMLTADIAYTRQGAGDPLVLMHGIGHRRQAWRPVIEPLAERFDVIAIDLPGFGDSPTIPAGTPYDADSTVARLGDFFTALGIEAPHVAGNSLGGAMALELAQRRLVRSVTAFAPAGFWTARQRTYALYVLQMHRRLTGLPPRTMQRVAHNPRLRAQAGRLICEHPERISPEDFLADAVALRTCPGWDAAVRNGRTYSCHASSRLPTTIAWGTKDKILHASQAQIARARLPYAQFRPLIGTGHVPMYDDPVAVVSAIVDTASRSQK